TGPLLDDVAEPAQEALDPLGVAPVDDGAHVRQRLERGESPRGEVEAVDVDGSTASRGDGPAPGAAATVGDDGPATRGEGEGAQRRRLPGPAGAGEDDVPLGVGAVVRGHL